nr:IS3 family transposase [Rhodococcus wratislaviensis]GLK35215.1 transposase [Rhodococcus wratislaviensis]
MSVARFIADQRTMHGVPHAFCCRVLGVSESWLYKWLGRGTTDRQRRRSALDAAVRTAFDASQGTYGSPRVHADLIDAGWVVSVNTVADSMRRQHLHGRKPKRCRSLTRQDKLAPKFDDLLRRDFSAPAPNSRWCGDMTEIPTDEGKLYLATVLDLFSRKLLACPTSEHPDAELACDAMKIATAVRGGRAVIDGVVFHTDRGSTYTAGRFTDLCRRIGVRQSMGRVGSCFDNAAAEAFFSTLEHEVLSRHHFTTRAQACEVVVAWCLDFYNTRRRQLRGIAVARRLRKDHRRPTGRSIKEPSTIRGEAQSA